jgi:hypothetical protein
MALYNLTNGSIADATQVMANFNKLTPVGTVMTFDDLNGVNTVDTDIWAALNGQTISDVLSVYNGLTLKDVSGRYIVGYGTDGGGDIASAAYSMTIVGNAGHSVNLAHIHQTAYRSGSNLGFYNINGSAVSEFAFAKTQFTGAGLAYGYANEIENQTFYTTSGGSTTQSIQPRSVTFRAYVRFK